jgi:hypothetical protein
MEINELKPFFAQAFTRLSQLEPLAEIYKARELKWIEDPRGLETDLEFKTGLFEPEEARIAREQREYEEMVRRGQLGQPQQYDFQPHQPVYE